jgi:hypothetical protein
MSIAEHTVEVVPTKLPARSQFRRPGEIAEPLLNQHRHTKQEIHRKPNVKRTLRARFSMPLLFCLLIAIAVRVWLVIHTQGFIDGDEALVGIQAEHILRGEFPVYFYNQPYMGSLEAYFMAILFAIMGPSVWALRAEPILLSLVVVWLTWKLAGILADMAHIPPHAKRWFMTISALLAAIPPLYDTVVELRTLGGYIETFVLMLLLMISALQLTRRQHAGASVRELTWRWAGIGFIVGLGFWVNPLIVSAVIVAGIWILWDYSWTGKRLKGRKVSRLASQATQRLAAISGGRGRPQGRSSLMNGQPQTHRGTGLLTGAGLGVSVGLGIMPGRAEGNYFDPIRSPRLLESAPIAAISGLGVRLPLETFPTTILPALRAKSKLALLLPIPAVLAGCILGLIPALLWGSAHQWQNFTYLFQLSGTPHLRTGIQYQYPTGTRLSIFFGLTQLYTTCVGPRLVGGGLPGESDLLAFLHTPMLILGVGCILLTILLVALSLPWQGTYRIREHLPLLVSIRRLTALPLLFAACTAVLFCGTTTAAIGLWSCQYDLAGRYAAPLMLALPFFFAGIIVAIILFESRVHDKVAGKFKHESRGQKKPQAPSIISTCIRRLSSGIAAFFRTQTILGILVALLLFSLYMQVFSYGLTDSTSTFQSPYCTTVPANNDAIIAYLQQEHIHYVWANNWIADPITFKTHENIIAVDPLPLIRQIPLLNRIPAETNAVLQADRPSMIIVVKQNDRYPLIEMILDMKNVTYHVARFPSVQNTDVLVVTPLSRQCHLLK